MESCKKFRTRETKLLLLFVFLICVISGCVNEPEYALDNINDIESNSFITKTSDSYTVTLTTNSTSYGARIKWNNFYNISDSVLITISIDSKLDSTFWLNKDIEELRITFKPESQEYKITFTNSYNKVMARNTEIVTIKLPTPKLQSIKLDPNGNIEVTWNSFTINKFNSYIVFSKKDNSSILYQPDTTIVTSYFPKTEKSHFNIDKNTLEFDVKAYLTNVKYEHVDSMKLSFDLKIKNYIKLSTTNENGDIELTFDQTIYNSDKNIFNNFYPKVRYTLFKINSLNDTTLIKEAFLNTQFEKEKSDIEFEFETKYFAIFYFSSKYEEIFTYKTNTTTPIYKGPPLEIISSDINYDESNRLDNIIFTVNNRLTFYDWNVVLNIISPDKSLQFEPEILTDTQFKFNLKSWRIDLLDYGEIKMWLETKIKTTDTLFANLSNDLNSTVIIENLPELNFKINELKTENFAYNNSNQFYLFYEDENNLQYKIYDLPSEPLDLNLSPDNNFAIKIDTDKWMLKSFDGLIEETINAKVVFPGFVVNESYENVLSYFAVQENKIELYVYDNTTNSFIKKDETNYNPNFTKYIGAYKNVIYSIEQNETKTLMPFTFYYNEMTRITYDDKPLFNIPISNNIFHYSYSNFIIVEPNTTKMVFYNSDFVANQITTFNNSILFSNLEFIKPSYFNLDSYSKIVYKKENNWFVHRFIKNSTEKNPHLEHVDGETIIVRFTYENKNFEYINRKLIQKDFQVKLEIIK